MTRRRLECACGVQVQPLCPFHAAQRHLLRLRLRGSVGPDDPLLPAPDGGFMPAGVELTYTVHRPQRQPAAALRRSRRPRRPHAGYSAPRSVDLPSGGEVHPECSAGSGAAVAALGNALGPGGGPRPLALQAAPVSAGGPCAEAAPGAEGPRGDGVPDVVYVAPPPNDACADLEGAQDGDQRGGPRQGGVGDPLRLLVLRRQELVSSRRRAPRSGCMPPLLPAAGETADEDAPPAQAEERESSAESGSDASAAVEVD